MKYSTPLTPLILPGLVVILLASGGCAKHSDFVQLRDDFRTLAESRDELQKQQMDMQRSLEKLDRSLQSGMKKVQASGSHADMVVLRLQIEELIDKLTMLEKRLAYVEVETQGQGQVTGGRVERPSQQSKTAKLDPGAAAGTSLSERPGLTPTSAYNLAYNDYLSGRYELAVTGFQRFVEDFPSTSLTPNAHYWLGESYYSMKDYVRAMQAFERVIKDYPKSEKVPPALYKLGLAAGETGDTRRSRAFLKRVIQEYKDSNEAKLAKNRLAELQ